MKTERYLMGIYKELYLHEIIRILKINQYDILYQGGNPWRAKKYEPSGDCLVLIDFFVLKMATFGYVKNRLICLRGRRYNYVNFFHLYINIFDEAIRTELMRMAQLLIMR